MAHGAPDYYAQVTELVLGTAFRNNRVSLYTEDTPAEIGTGHADAVATTRYLLATGAYLYGFNGATWDRLRVDANKYLKVAVEVSALPTGAATAANQATIIGHIDGIETAQGRIYGYDGANWQTLLVESAAQKNLRVALFSAGVQAEIGSISADAVATTRNALWTGSYLYGYNGTTWDRLRTESNTAFNLRVKLYDGANGIDSSGLDENLTTQRGILACASVYGRYAGNDVRPIKAFGIGSDAVSSLNIALYVQSHLMGFNGTTWDRLRVYPPGILKVGRAAIGLSDTRVTGTGQVGAAGAKKLFWISMNPSAANSVIEVTDASAGGGAVKWDMFHSSRMGHIVTFDPPMEFATGIYVETWTAMTSAVFGYI